MDDDDERAEERVGRGKGGGGGGWWVVVGGGWGGIHLDRGHDGEGILMLGGNEDVDDDEKDEQRELQQT